MTREEKIKDIYNYKYMSKIAYTFDNRKRIFIKKFNKYFFINHKPSLMRMFKKGNTFEYIISNWDISTIEEWCYMFVSTDKYNEDIGMFTNLEISLFDIDELWFFEDDYKK